jgi:hypothetical protein
MSAPNKSPEAKKCYHHSCVPGNCVYESWTTDCTYPNCDKGIPKGSAYKPKEDEPEQPIGDLPDLEAEYLD